jgi:hypothetical protein
MPSRPPSPIKPSYQLYCGVDIASKTFTAATCIADEEPTKALNFKQSPQNYAQLQKHLLSSRVTPGSILIVMEATGTYWLELVRRLSRLYLMNEKRGKLRVGSKPSKSRPHHLIGQAIPVPNQKRPILYWKSSKFSDKGRVTSSL